MERDLFDLVGGKEHTGQIREQWIGGLEAIVAVVDDPEHRHRIKVKIPAIDENQIHDMWVDRLVWFTGPEGYGDFHLPGIGSEVVLFGRLGEKKHLYYMSRFNEDFIVPPEFRSSTVKGFRTDGDCRMIVDLDFYMRGGRVMIESDASVRIIAPGGLFVNGNRVG